MGSKKKYKNKKQLKPWKWSKEHKLILTGVFVVIIVGVIYWYYSLAPPELLKPPLKDLAATDHVTLGVHVDSRRLSSSIYPNIVASQFSFLTIDGDSQFEQIQPGLKTFDFSGTDKMVDFAEAHNMPVQFHHLVWGDPYFLPDWLKNGNYSKDQIMQILHDHINAIADRYKGRVKEYTVVNEAFAESQHVYGVQNWFAEHLGSNTAYIDQMFKWAHQDDPNAKLLLNDFDNETKTSVSDAMFNYIKAAKARGVPIDGIGMQLHVDASRPPNKLAMITNMQRFAQIGVPVYVTEFDIDTNRVKGGNNLKQYLESQIVKNVAGACVASKNCHSFDVFGLTNKNDLIKTLTHTKSRAYMFDSRYRPRQQYYALRAAW